MKRIEVESTSLKSAGYDEEGHILEVEFVHGGIYQYMFVSRDVYQGLMKAESKGRYYLERIRNEFPFLRVSPKKEG